MLLERTTTLKLKTAASTSRSYVSLFHGQTHQFLRVSAALDTKIMQQGTVMCRIPSHAPAGKSLLTPGGREHRALLSNMQRELVERKREFLIKSLFLSRSLSCSLSLALSRSLPPPFPLSFSLRHE